MKLKIFPLICMSVLASFTNVEIASAQQGDTILTNNVVELKETKSPQGFIHPGIDCNAETLSVMREKVKAGASPWVDYFEGMRRTRYANLNQKPRFVEQIVDNGGIGNFANDAQLAWVQTIMYVVTGNEEYRKLPVQIINWYGARTDKSFFPRAFPDSHIKIGKYVYTMCSAVDILRATTPKDGDLAVTQEMIDALQKNCMYPIRKNCIERNYYFMNQHSYAIMGYLASTVMGDEVEDYKQAVEWTTVNATLPNQGRNGSINQQIRLMTRNDKTGETVEPHLQVVEMGRDQPHAGGNVDNLLMMAKTIEFQKTKVDPIDGTVTKANDGVSTLHFQDNRLPKGAALFAKYNIGFGLPWVPAYSESAPDNKVTYNQISYYGRGSIGGSGAAASYYYYKALGFDMKSGPYKYIKAAFDTMTVSRESDARSGVYLDQLHNYAFDFWVGLPADASNAAPDPEKARRALSVTLPPLNVTRDGVPSQGQQFEYQFVDLSAHAQPGDIYPGSPTDAPLKVSRDADGTGYVRMTITKNPRTIVVPTRFPIGSGLRLRSDSAVKLSFYRDEDFARRGLIQEIYVPNTEGKWNNVVANFEGNDLIYIQATPLDGPSTLDFDRIEPKTENVQAPSFNLAGESKSLSTYVGEPIKNAFTATRPDKYLIGGAKWVPGKLGSALNFNGNEQYAKLPDGIVSDLQDFSVSTWIKLDKLDRFARIFDFGDSRESYMFLAVSDGRVPKFAIRGGGKEEQAVTGRNPLPIGVWQHVALTLSGNTAILYVNGEEVGRNPNITFKPANLGKTQQNYLGKSQWPDPYLTGSVDDFTIFNKALSASEVANLSSGNQRVDSKALEVRYKFDQQTVDAESAKSKIEYTASNLPTGAKFDTSTGTLTWTPTSKQQGDHVTYITARNDDTIQTLPLHIHVARNLQAALDHVALIYDPAQRYVSATERAFKAALKSRDLAALQQAATGLELLNPHLSDGTLDFRKIWSGIDRSSSQMADSDPMSWGGFWGAGQNITMDFGDHFKVRADEFRLQARDGFPERGAQVIIHGSNDGQNWTLWTENRSINSSDMQTLKVKDAARTNAFRYLRITSAQGFLEIAEFRIVGERIEN